MVEDKVYRERKKMPQRQWLLALMIGLGLALATAALAFMDAASPTSFLLRTQLSAEEQFAAYPDIDGGDAGILVAVWIEGESSYRETVQMRWMDQDMIWQSPFILDQEGQFSSPVVVVSGATAHLAWIANNAAVRYRQCQINGSVSCSEIEEIAPQKEGNLVSQVKIALDGNTIPHLVWIESEGSAGDTKVHYNRRPWGTSFSPPNAVESSRPAIACAGGYVHVVWIEHIWIEDVVSYPVVKYCRRDADESGDTWSHCEGIANWQDYTEQNLSIAADENCNVYVLWDFIMAQSLNEYTYAIGYRHSEDDGKNWKAMHTYPQGDYEGSGSTLFRTLIGEEGILPETQSLRPQVSLAVSSTATVTANVPILVWHAQTTDDNPVGGYEIFWSYASVPGSDAEGNMAWQADHAPLSVGLAGGTNPNIGAASPQAVAVGNLNDLRGGSALDDGAYLHTVYHEQSASQSDRWVVVYHNNERLELKYKIYLPLSLRNLPRQRMNRR